MTSLFINSVLTLSIRVHNIKNETPKGVHFLVVPREYDTCVSYVGTRIGVARPFVSCNQETGLVTESRPVLMYIIKN